MREMGEVGAVKERRGRPTNTEVRRGETSSNDEVFVRAMEL